MNLVVIDAHIFLICPAELFVSIFHLFEAGIANANYSFQWWKMCVFIKSGHLKKSIIWLTEHL